MQHRDTAVLGIVAGILGGTVYQVFIWMFYLMGFAKITPFQLGAYISVKPGSDITLLSAQLLGMVQHYSLSILVAVIALYLLRQIGIDHAWLKGLALGAIINLFIYGLTAKAVIPVSVLQPDLATSTIYMFAHLIFGLVIVFTYIKYSA